MNAQLQAIIFDADGTLLDTREFIYQALEQTLATHGHEVPTRDIMSTHMGKHLIDMYQSIAPSGDSDAMAGHHRKLHDAELLHLVAGYEGLHELLRSIRALGLKIAVCTSRGKNADVLLRQVGVRDDIDVLVTADDVEHHKPHPEAVLKSLSALACMPEHAVMIGDTTADIGAGKAAGVAATIGVTHGFGKESVLREAGADHIVHHLNDILPLLHSFK